MKIGFEIRKIKIRSVAVSVSISGSIDSGLAHCGTASKKTKQRLEPSLSLLILTLSVLGASCQRPSSPQPTQAAQPTQAQVTLGYIHHDERASAPDAPQAQEKDPQPPQPPQWTLSDGTRLELEQFLWVISDVELHACEPKAPERALRWPWLISSAYAHVPTSSTRHGAPYVEDLLFAPERARIVGELGPPMGQYCAIYTVIAPADADVINATATSTEALLGKSYWIKGRLMRPSAQAWEDFDLSGELKLVARVEGINPKDAQAPLTLAAQTPSAFILLDKTIKASTFEPLIQGDKPDTASAQAIITRLAQGQRVYRKTTP